MYDPTETPSALATGFRPALLAILAASSFAFAQTTSTPHIPTAAVMPLEAKGVSATDADVITDAIATHLQQGNSLRVLERAQMDRILSEQGLSKSGACDASECAVEMGKLLSVDQILVGAVGLVGRTYSLNLRLVSVQTGEVLRSRMRSYPGTIDDVLTRLVPETVTDLLSAPTTKDRTASDSPKASGSGTHWGWWLAGGALLAGGAATAVILSSGSGGKSPSPSPVVPTYNSLDVSW